MTTDDVIDGIVQREGGYVDNPSDRGGPTRWGVTAKTLGEYRRLGRPATRAEVQGLAIEEARLIYRARYVRPFDAVPFDELRAQLVDFGVTSGPVTAIRSLQGVLGVPVDGVLGTRTLTALSARDWRLVNGLLVISRVKLFADIVGHDAAQLQFLRGWILRAVGFAVNTMS